MGINGSSEGKPGIKVHQPMDWPVILASGSPRRKEILGDLGLKFSVVTSGCDEVETGLPDKVAVENAWLKARAVAEENRDYLVIGSDTVVAQGTELYGKPRDMDDAFRMLSDLNGRIHSVISGVAVIGIEAGIEFVFSDETKVFMKQVGDEDLREYLELIEPLDKAGGYAIQDHGDMIVDHIEGSFLNVVGFPAELFAVKWAHYISR